MYTATLSNTMQYILLRRDSEKKKMAMLVQEITRKAKQILEQSNRIRDFRYGRRNGCIRDMADLDAVFRNSRIINR